MSKSLIYQETLRQFDLNKHHSINVILAQNVLHSWLLMLGFFIIFCAREIIPIYHHANSFLNTEANSCNKKGFLFVPLSFPYSLSHSSHLSRLSKIEMLIFPKTHSFIIEWFLYGGNIVSFVTLLFCYSVSLFREQQFFPPQCLLKWKEERFFQDRNRGGKKIA